MSRFSEDNQDDSNRNQSENPRKKNHHTTKHLKVWTRLCVIVFVITMLFVCSTVFLDSRAVLSAQEEEPPGQDASGWEEPVYAYVLASDDALTVPIYDEALTSDSECGRGTCLEMESWTPVLTEDGREFYRIFWNGKYGYIACENITDDKEDLLQEEELYVRTSVNLLTEPDGYVTGSLAEKGDLLRVVDCDYFLEDGQVHMYKVKLGEEIGWISSSYVTFTYAEALENWNNDANIYAIHAARGDTYGGGDAADLDYWPHEKGDFSADGNVMPKSCYALYIAAYEANPEGVQQYLDMAEGTEVNTFVITILDDGELAYPSEVIDEQGLLGAYAVDNTWEEFLEAIQMLKDAGYYVVARITAFKDVALASSRPEWSITDLNGNIMEIAGSYWPSVFCRDVWECRAALALEAVDEFGFQEIQFDYVRFPDNIIDYEEAGTVDLKNEYGESKAQAVQRFLLYVTDLIHSHGAYVSADVFGETVNTYVTPYGQYWAAISTVVDVISGMPYPDHFSSYYINEEYYRPYKHPYVTLREWADNAVARQAECSSPAIVRTWVQTWDDSDYDYDELAIMRQVVALYDADITGGFMPWLSYGSLAAADNIGCAINYDYYALYLDAQKAGISLSDYMDLNTDE